MNTEAERAEAARVSSAAGVYPMEPVCRRHRPTARAGRLGLLPLCVAVACSDGTQPRVPSSVELNVTSVRVEEGESATVVATVLDQHGTAFAAPPEGFVVAWSSSAPSVASVSQGKITGEAPGDAIVSAKAGNLAPANVAVAVDAAAVADIQLYAETNLLHRGSTLQLHAYLFGARGNVLSPRPVEWTSLDPDIATVSESGLLTGHLAGWARIFVSSGGHTDGMGFHVRPARCTGTPVGTLAVPDTVFGTLDGNDCDSPFDGPWPIATFSDAWRLDIETPVTVRIDLVSDDFDAVLYLSDLELNLIDYDDDGGDDWDARIERELPVGSYLIWASSYFANETGDYRLTVR